MKNPFLSAGVTFAGTAMPVDFDGAAGGIGFADITLGTNNPIFSEPAPSPPRSQDEH